MLKKACLSIIALAAVAAHAQDARNGSAVDSRAPTSASSPFQLNAVITQGFDSVAVAPNPSCALDATAMVGWVGRNNSTPAGTTCIFNPTAGATLPFPAQAGAATTSYAAMNFNAVAGAATISTWLISPRVNFGAGSQLEFWIRSPASTATPANQAFPDRLEVRLTSAAAGADTDVGTTNASVGVFTTVLVDVNPTLGVVGTTCPATGITDPAGGTITGFPVAGWCRIVLTNAAGIPATGAGRVAFRYFVTDGGSGANSNFIGIDSFSFTEGTVAPVVARVPTPAINFGGAIALLIGLAGIGMLASRRYS